MPARVRTALAAAVVLLSSAAEAEETASEISKLASAPTLEREAYVRAVLNANPDIASARHGWRAAQARARQGGAFDDPMIELSMAPLSIGSSDTRFGYEVGIRQALPWFGTQAVQRHVLEAEAAAAASDLDMTRRETAMIAIALYSQYFVVLRSLEINAQHVQLLRALHHAATAQLEGGRGSVQDALQAEAELTELERDTIVLTSERDVLVAQMNELLRRDPAEPLPPTGPELATQAPPHARDAKQLAGEAVKTRAEVRSARLRAQAEATREDAASREYYPTFTVMTSYSSMWDMPEHRWMLGVGLNVPLPTDRRAGAEDEARAARAQFESEADRLTDRVHTEVYVALRKLDESEQVLGLYRSRLLPVARQRVDAAQASFTASQGSFMSVIEAERSLRSVELKQKMAEAEHDLRRAELERVVGRIPGLGQADAR